MDDEEDQNPIAPLDQYRELFTTMEGRAVGEVTAEKIKAFTAVRDAAAASQAEADQAVANIETFKAGLTRFVERDPTGMPLALDLVKLYVPTMVEPYGAEHVEPLAQHIQSEIARTGVQSFALRDEGAARQAMDRYAEHLTDDDRGVLDGFIGTMARARFADAETAAAEQGRLRRDTSDKQAFVALSALSNPETGDLRFPDRWLQSIASDKNLSGDMKVSLWNAHERLRNQGDVTISDASAVTDLVKALANPDFPSPSPADIIDMAGDRLRLGDAQMLASAALPGSPALKRELNALDATLDTARRKIAPPENGRAGELAYERFVNWLLPEYRGAGPGSLSPRAENYILTDTGARDYAFWDNFAPRLDDFVVDVNRANTGGTADRPSLKDIFSGERRGAPAGDVVIPTPRIARPVPPQGKVGAGDMEGDSRPVDDGDWSPRPKES